MAPGDSPRGVTQPLEEAPEADARPADQDAVAERAKADGNLPPSRAEALAMLRARGAGLRRLLRRAEALRRARFGRRVHCCSIVAFRRGGCSEDCAFCAQSARFSTGVAPSPPLDPKAILAAAQEAEASGAGHFGLVASGRSLSEGDFRRALRAVELVASRTGLKPCASLGALTADRARALAEAGCVRYNHNLETSRRFFPRLCTTHRYRDRLQTILRARAAGLKVCSGGLIGAGETLEDRVELAFALRELNPEVIPLNVLVPIPGTPLAGMPPVPPVEVLATVAMFRLVNPGSVIKLAGGRERALGRHQPGMFRAGANALILGNYLTTAGRPAEEDLAMIRRLGLVPDGPRQLQREANGHVDE